LCTAGEVALQFEFTSLHCSVRQVPHISENCSESARVRAIRDLARTRRKPSPPARRVGQSDRDPYRARQYGQFESYSELRGFFHQYELYYVVADERDLVELRMNYRGEQVYLYRIHIAASQARALLLLTI
jgi:hypothetical protein